MIDKELHNSYQWTSKPKLMLQSFNFFDESEELKTHLSDEEQHQKIFDKMVSNWRIAKEKIVGFFNKSQH